MPSPVARLIEFGQSPWNDNLTRALATGGLDALMREHGIRGVTSNPTIFEKAMAAGGDYDAQLRDLVHGGASTEDAYWELVLTDIAHAADRLRPIYDELDGADGFVSVEVSPNLANDTQGTIEQANELWRRLARPNVMIKIPATAEGVPAITETLAAGVNVNITLIFSLRRYAEVIEAFMLAMERRLGRGEDASRLASVASFFVSRIDTETDRRLAEGSPLRGRAAVANAKLAYQLFLERFSGSRWDALRHRPCPFTAAAVGVDLDEEPRLLAHALRRRPDRARHGEHPGAAVDRRAGQRPGEPSSRFGARRRRGREACDERSRRRGCRLRRRDGDTRARRY